MRIRWTEPAARDLEGICDYIRKTSIGVRYRHRSGYCGAEACQMSILVNERDPVLAVPDVVHL